MKSKIKLSTYSSILTVSIVGLLLGIGIYTYGTSKFYILLTVLLLLVIFGCLYAPLGIEADENNITVKGILKNRRIPIGDIDFIVPFQPTIGAIRICGSGGFMGYWGIFREGDVGRYMAWYGRSSDCFFIRMKNGDKYVLGCEQPEKMMEYIKSNLR